MRTITRISFMQEEDVLLNPENPDHLVQRLSNIERFKAEIMAVSLKLANR